MTIREQKIRCHAICNRNDYFPNICSTPKEYLELTPEGDPWDKRNYVHIIRF